ncbi:uncharacterized protein H6S33_011067 [Morchella sextelata]|uniref:uncharacterized protein n=1 Tax=Morchella sextelata TaxID=1174677 RepID=UPI001D037BB0|nr:uncharacterized protein H6S33_011067 [Morchella sextelata]KAH0611802.1 hypothetical protein H6S33_011067 [Morchella sextelata]
MESLTPLFVRQRFLHRKLDIYGKRYGEHIRTLDEDRQIAQQFCPKMMKAFDQHQRFEMFRLKERIGEIMEKIEDVQKKIEQKLEELRSLWIL